LKFLLHDGAKGISGSKKSTACAVRSTLSLWVVFVIVGRNPLAMAQAQPQLGMIAGTVVDTSGAVISGAKVTLTQTGATSTGSASAGSTSAGSTSTGTESTLRNTLSDSAGQFAFADVPPGPFQVSVSASGFAPSKTADILQPGEHRNLVSISLSVAPADVDVEVKIAPEQIAEDEVKAEEKQRLFGVIPNYYMTFDPHAAPLTTRLKFQLAWKDTIDPVSFGIVGAIAGFEQAADTYGGYGQGAAGYARRYGAAYGDFVSSTFIGGAILPSLLKQDPRYFYKGTGTTKARLEYALANAVIRKGDNGRWQPDYSGILGGLAAGGISNLYYPDADRNGARLTFENTAIGIGFTGAVNIIQEFLFKKLTTHAADPGIDKQPDRQPDRQPAKQSDKQP
jgi:hypothetical protein